MLKRKPVCTQLINCYHLLSSMWSQSFSVFFHELCKSHISNWEEKWLLLCLTTPHIQVHNHLLQPPVHAAALLVTSPAPHQGAASKQGSVVMGSPTVPKERMKPAAIPMTTSLPSQIGGGALLGLVTVVIMVVLTVVFDKSCCCLSTPAFCFFLFVSSLSVQLCFHSLLVL